MPDIQWQLSAQENVSQAVQRIGQSLAGLDSSNAKTFGGMVQSLSNAQNAATRAATALQRLETAQAQTEAAQSRAASAALRLQEQTTKAAAGMESMGRAAQQHGPAVSSFFSNALSAATGFLGAQVFSRITGALVGVGQGALEQAGQLEQLQVAFTGLLGSSQAASAELAKLRDLANRTPFEFPGLAKADQMMLAVGIDADHARSLLIDAGNATAAFGGSADQLNSVALAIEQIHSKGKLQGQEALQLVNAGIPVWQLLAETMGKSTAQVQDLAQQGRITADVFEQAFHTYAVEHWGGAMEKQSHTIQGLASTASDLGKTLEATFGSGVIEAVEPEIEKIVNALSDPSVQTTLAQWGQAAGQFAVGLIQAGETAFTVAGQIIQALSPVTDFLGQLLGIQGPAAPTIKPPDFTPAAQSAGLFAQNMQAGGAQTKSAKDQVADLERQTRELSRATAEANLGYDHRKQSLQDQLTLLDRQYQAENKAADIQSLQAKIAKDRALARDAYSSQGQSAASRLPDEEARLAQLQREQGHDAAKNAIEDRIKSIDREKQATDEASAARTRALQEQMDALRANAAATTALVNVIKPPAPDASKNRNVNDAFGDNQTAAKAQGTLGLLQQLAAALNGDKGVAAAVLAVKTAWGQLTDAFAVDMPGLTLLKTSIDDIAHALGLDAGFAAQSVIAQAAFKTFTEVSLAVVPQNLAVIGAGLAELNNQLNVTAKGLTLVSDKLKGADDRTIAADLAALAGALQRQDSDRQRGVAGYFQQAAQGQKGVGDIFQQNYEDTVKGLLKAGQQGIVSSTGGGGADFGNGVISSPDRGGGVGTDFAGPGVTTTQSRRDQAVAARHDLRIEFDNAGLARVVDKRTGQALQDALR